MAAPVCVIIRNPLAVWLWATTVAWLCLPISVMLLIRVLDSGVITYELGGWAENFLGATIENEEFANRINKGGKYTIIFKPSLNVSHNFKDLKGLLKTIFQRSIIWTQLKISKTVGYDGLVRTKLTALVTLQSILLLFFLTLALFGFLGLGFFAICLTIYFLGNFRRQILDCYRALNRRSLIQY